MQWKKQKKIIRIQLNKKENAVNPIKKGLGAFFMTRKAKISFLVLVWGIVAIQMGVNYKEREKMNSMVTAFSIAEEAGTEKVIEGYGYFGQMELSNGNKKEMLQSLSKRLNLEGDYEWSQSEDEGCQRIILEYQLEKGKIVLQFITVTTQEAPKQYIAMKIESYEEVKEIVTLYKKIKDLYKEIEVEATIYLEVEQEKRGNITKTDANQIIKDIFSILDAKEVERVTEQEIYTVYGYTPKEEDYLILNKEKVNVSVALYYDETTDKTYIKIGLPIINSSY